VQGGAFLAAEGGEQVVFDQAEFDVGGGERFLACRGQLDDVTSPVGAIAPPRDQPACFQVVQQPDDVARIEAQHLAEALLAQGPSLAQDPERAQVPGSETTRRRGLGGPAADPSEVIEQREGLVVHLRRQLGHTPRLHPGRYHWCITNDTWYANYSSSSRPLEGRMSKLQVIVGSTRPTRSSDLVVPWVVSRASAHEGFDVEVIDLRDWPLPLFAEHVGTIGDFSDPTYSEPSVKAWNNKIKEADAFVVVTPEYNHSLPGVLKNAIDSVFLSFAFRNKPIAAVGYSAGIGAGIRAIEHLAQVVIEAEAVPLRNTVVIPFVATAFDELGEAVDPAANVSLDVMLDDLAWWSLALEAARAAGELIPGALRGRAALAAARAARDVEPAA
jgi:NAD(P)H-dependent FMN reductase